MKYRLGTPRKEPGGILYPLFWFEDDADLTAYPPPMPILNDQVLIPESSPDRVTAEQLEEAIYERGWELEHTEEIDHDQLSPAVQQMMAEAKPLGSTGTLPASVRAKRKEQEDREQRQAAAAEREAKQQTRTTDDPSSGGANADDRRDELESRTTKRGR